MVGRAGLLLVRITVVAITLLVDCGAVAPDAQACVKDSDCLYPDCADLCWYQECITPNGKPVSVLCLPDSGRFYPTKVCMQEIDVDRTAVLCLAGTCPANTYLDLVSRPYLGQCIACPAGTFYDGWNQGTSCTACTPGKYQPSAASACVHCAVGTYTDAPRATACRACSAGLYALAEGMTACVRYDDEPAYVPGTRYLYRDASPPTRLAEWRNCSSCGSAGTWAGCTNTSDAVCASASPAFANPVYDAAVDAWLAPFKCGPGEYLRGFESVAGRDCRRCPADMVGRDGLKCERCGPLEEPDVWLDGSACVCKPPAVMRTSGACGCPDGWRLVGGGCEPCPGNWSYGVAGGLECRDCGAGNFSSAGGGATACERCAAGKYRVAIGDGCQSCEPGWFAPDAGSGACARCNTSCGSGWRDGGACPSHEEGSGYRVCVPCEVGLPRRGASRWVGECVFECEAGLYYAEGECVPCSTSACSPGKQWEDCTRDADRRCEVDCVSNASKPLFNAKWAASSKAGECPWECEAGFALVKSDYVLFEISECVPVTPARRRS